MDTLTFIANLVQNLAWPITVLITVIVFRKPIINILALIQRLKYKDMELEFGNRIEEAKAEAAEQLPAGVQEITTPSRETEAIIKLAEISPRAAILEAWRSVELAALATARLISDEKFYTMNYKVIATLEHNQKVDHSAINLLKELRALRNEAAHAPDFVLSQESVLEYAALAERVKRYLQSISNKD